MKYTVTILFVLMTVINLTTYSMAATTVIYLYKKLNCETWSNDDYTYTYGPDYNFEGHALENAQSVKTVGVWDITLIENDTGNQTHIVFSQQPGDTSCTNRADLTNYDLTNYKFGKVHRYGEQQTTVQHLLLFTGKGLTGESFQIKSNLVLEERKEIQSVILFGAPMKWVSYGYEDLSGPFSCFQFSDPKLESGKFEIVDLDAPVMVQAVRQDATSELCKGNGIITPPPEGTTLAPTTPSYTGPTEPPELCNQTCKYAAINCHTYFTCVDFHHKEYHHCPEAEGLAFNPVLGVCDLMSNVPGCQKCTCEYRPHPTNCTQYYYCPNTCGGTEEECELKTCPGGLHWTLDAEGDGRGHQQCVKAEKAKCNSRDTFPS